MKIVRFSVSRYRSILEAERIEFGDHTILIGKNNEGKSNILRALSTAIEAIRFYSVSREGRSIAGRRSYVLSSRNAGLRYDWHTDFPIPLQAGKTGTKKTRFRIDFELDGKEVSDFYERFGLTVNSLIPIVIEIPISGEVELSIAKPGRGSATYSKKTKEICGYIIDKLDFIYVPAVRTDRDAMVIVSNLLRSSLSEVEDLPEYKSAVNEIFKAQKPILDRIATDIAERLRKFLPSIKAVSIDTSVPRINSSLSRDIELIIDDGVATHLDAKGDGIKSLVALSLFHSSPTLGKSRVIAIEEPESHLHHGAVHELKRVLRDLSSDGQVIISTHNPSFVDRDHLRSVVLVEAGRAERVTDVAKLRRSLGVLVSDNLINSEFSIVCEGSHDAKALASIFSSLSPRLRSLIANGNLVFDTLEGASKLSYKLSTLNRDVFKYYAILDNDDSGKSSVLSAINSNILSDADYSLLRIRGNLEAELEDALNTDGLRPLVLRDYGLDVADTAFGGTKKWSDRMKAGFESAGKVWSSETEGKLKALAGTLFEEKPIEKMRDGAVTFFRTVTSVLEKRFS